MHFPTSVSAVLVAASCAVATYHHEPASYGVSSSSYNNHVYGRDVDEAELLEREIVDNYLFARDELAELVARATGVGEVKEGLQLERTGHMAAGKAAVKDGIRKEQQASRKNTKKPRDLEFLEDILDLVARANGVGEVREGLHLENTGHMAAGRAAVKDGIRKEERASRKNTKKPRSIEDFDDHDDVFDLMARGKGAKEVQEGLKLEESGHKAAGKAAVKAGEKKERKASRKAGAKAPRSLLLELD